jgi:hypothetical protein
MPYTYPEFAWVIRSEEVPGKRYSLEVGLEEGGEGTCLVIQKNPSKANGHLSDHTINRVLNYIYRNRDRYAVLENVGKVVYLNLIPLYETFSNRLVYKKELAADPVNTRVIFRYLQEGAPSIIGWGNPAPGLARLHNRLAEGVLNSLRRDRSEVYHVGGLTRLGHPRHGQIWGYGDPLIRLDL